MEPPGNGLPLNVTRPRTIASGASGGSAQPVTANGIRISTVSLILIVTNATQSTMGAGAKVYLTPRHSNKPG
jgi:hypothetical protein